MANGVKPNGHQAAGMEHKILLVEDDENIRLVLSQLLAFEGYIAIPARNGSEALALLHDHRTTPCLILTDLVMPEMTGYELVSLLAAEARLVVIPVVVISGDTDPKLAGTRKFFKKPINVDALMAVVKEYCGAPIEPPTYRYG